MKPLVAVVGRPNVGKSTFVNRLIGKREAIVDDLSGVTRDRMYFDVEWFGSEFVVIDTGGIIPDETDSLLQQVQIQVNLAIDEADAIIFLVDGRDGITAVDLEIAQKLRFTKKPIILTVNKVDNDSQKVLTSEFYELNLGEPTPISSIHSYGIDVILDRVIDSLPKGLKGEDEDTESLKIAVIGRPNVGKSSIVNVLLGEDRLIVHDVAGTTRDSVDTKLVYYGKKYTLVDTAGIRRKARVDYGVEKFSVARSIKAMENADVVALVIDASRGVTEQEQRIAGMIVEKGKACIIIVNKWDLIIKDDSSLKSYANQVKERLYFIDYAPIIFTSAITRKRLFNIFEVAESAIEEHNKRVTTGLLNQIINESVALSPPPTNKGRELRIYYTTQIKVAPPTFILFINDNNLFPTSYLKYIENKVREAFGFSGTPIRFILRKKEKIGRTGRS